MIRELLRYQYNLDHRIETNPLLFVDVKALKGMEIDDGVWLGVDYGNKRVIFSFSKYEPIRQSDAVVTQVYISLPTFIAGIGIDLNDLDSLREVED